MRLYLLVLGHRLDEDNVVCSPVLTPAEDVEQAEAIGDSIADHLGIELMEEPKFIGDFS